MIIVSPSVAQRLRARRETINTDPNVTIARSMPGFSAMIGLDEPRSAPERSDQTTASPQPARSGRNREPVSE